MFKTTGQKSMKDAEAGTELNKINVNGNVKATTTCTPEVCRSARHQFQPPNLTNSSPWNEKKTYFFIGIMVLLLVWVIIYATVSELKLV